MKTTQEEGDMTKPRKRGKKDTELVAEAAEQESAGEYGADVGVDVGFEAGEDDELDSLFNTYEYEQPRWHNLTQTFQAIVTKVETATRVKSRKEVVRVHFTNPVVLDGDPLATQRVKERFIEYTAKKGNRCMWTFALRHLKAAGVTKRDALIGKLATFEQGLGDFDSDSAPLHQAPKEGKMQVSTMFITGVEAV